MVCSLSELVLSLMGGFRFGNICIPWRAREFFSPVPCITRIGVNVKVKSR